MLRDAPLSAGQIAGRFAISRPAVSRHLRVLREAGLVRDTADGRRRVYTLVTAPLDELAGWLGRLMRPSGWQQTVSTSVMPRIAGRTWGPCFPNRGSPLLPHHLPLPTRRGISCTRDNGKAP